MKSDSRPNENYSELNEWHSFKIHFYRTWESEDLTERGVGYAGEWEGEEIEWDHETGIV